MGKRDQQREQAAADALAALGNRTRLRIFKLLVRAGPGGANVGTVQRMLNVPATTLAHHLGTLSLAGLVGQERRGREVICTANYKAVADVLDYVKGECCAGLDAAETGRVGAVPGVRAKRGGLRPAAPRPVIEAATKLPASPPITIFRRHPSGDNGD